MNESLADGEEHDAQEFQIYLLDALHEDTNRVMFLHITQYITICYFIAKF